MRYDRRHPSVFARITVAKSFASNRDVYTEAPWPDTQTDDVEKFVQVKVLEQQQKLVGAEKREREQMAT